MRAREIGRAGPLSRKPAEVAGASSSEKADPKPTAFSLTDPAKEMDKVESLYESVMEARRRAGEKTVPFHKFTDLVRRQVKKLRESGYANVTFQVVVKEGRVNLKARGSKKAAE